MLACKLAEKAWRGGHGVWIHTASAAEARMSYGSPAYAPSYASAASQAAPSYGYVYGQNPYGAVSPASQTRPTPRMPAPWRAASEREIGP